MLAEVESAELAEQLISETCTKQGIERGQLTIHADNGAAMTAKSLALLMADLGVAKSHTRPYQSNDNCYSEAHFKTFKYRPGYPDRFGSLADARTWASQFFTWYNHQHHHSGLALLTPFDVHYGWLNHVLDKRQAALSRAYKAHPERFVKGPPVPARPPEAAWINPPKADNPVSTEQETVTTRSG
jgi:putative transposase